MSGSESPWRPRMSPVAAGRAAGAAELHCKIIPAAVVLSPFSRPAAWSPPAPPWPAEPAPWGTGAEVAGVAAVGDPVAPSAASAGVAGSAGSGSGCKLHRRAHAAASAMRPARCRRASHALCPPLHLRVGRPPLLLSNGRAPAGKGWPVLCCDRLTSGAGMAWHRLQMVAGWQGESNAGIR